MVLYRCGSVYLKCTQLSLPFEYFELNNIPFGQLVYLSVVTMSHFQRYIPTLFWGPELPKLKITGNHAVTMVLSYFLDPDVQRAWHMLILSPICYR